MNQGSLKIDCGYKGDPAKLFLDGPKVKVKIAHGHIRETKVVSAILDTSWLVNFIDQKLADELDLPQTNRWKEIIGNEDVRVARIYIPEIKEAFELDCLSADPSQIGSNCSISLGRALLADFEMKYIGLTGEVSLTYTPSPVFMATS